MTVIPSIPPRYVRFDGMVWPGLYLGELGWNLRHADDVNMLDRMMAASVVSAYVALVNLPIKERNRVCAGIRRGEYDSTL